MAPVEDLHMNSVCIFLRCVCRTCGRNPVCAQSEWPWPSRPGRTEPCPQGADHQTYWAESAGRPRHNSPLPDTEVEIGGWVREVAFNLTIWHQYEFIKTLLFANIFLTEKFASVYSYQVIVVLKGVVQLCNPSSVPS